MLAVYIAHQLSGDVEANRAAASRWVGLLAMTFDIAPIADWIIMTGQWTEEHRARGLRIDMELVSRADEMWMVGPHLSNGMALEMGAAQGFGKPVVNLVGLDHAQAVACLRGRGYR